MKIFISRTTGPISTKLGFKHPWLKGNEGLTNKDHLIIKKEMIGFLFSPNQHYDIIMVDLNWFLRWAIWCMGLLFYWKNHDLNCLLRWFFSFIITTGLYSVEKCWFTTGLSGFGVWKFALKRCPDQEPPPWSLNEVITSTHTMCTWTWCTCDSHKFHYYQYCSYCSSLCGENLFKWYCFHYSPFLVMNQQETKVLHQRRICVKRKTNKMRKR